MNGIQFGWYTVYMDNKVVNSLITSRNSKTMKFFISHYFSFFFFLFVSRENEADREKEKNDERQSKLTNRIDKITN